MRNRLKKAQLQQLN